MAKTKKIIFLRIFISLFIIIVLFHTTFHFALFGTGISGFGKSGISGNAVFNDLKENYENLNNTSRWLITAEWLAVIAIILYLLIKGKIKLDEEMTIGMDIRNNREAMKKYKKSKSETDLDVLYNILKEKKILRLKAISKIFSVNEKTAMNWCRILEEGNLAVISYPTVGDPKVVLEEYIKDEEKRDKEKERKQEKTKGKDKKKR